MGPQLFWGVAAGGRLGSPFAGEGSVLLPAAHCWKYHPGEAPPCLVLLGEEGEAMCMVNA